MKNRYFRASCVLLLAAGVMSCFGCGPKRPETSRVHGRVTYQGKPVVAGTITFQPEHGRPAMGEIKADGTYELTTFKSGDGAMPGKHRVAIEARRAAKVPPMEGTAASSDVPSVEWLVPQKYAAPDTSNLTAEVKPGDNPIDFNL